MLDNFINHLIQIDTDEYRERLMLESICDTASSIANAVDINIGNHKEIPNGDNEKFERALAAVNIPDNSTIEKRSDYIADSIMKSIGAAKVDPNSGLVVLQPNGVLNEKMDGVKDFIDENGKPVPRVCPVCGSKVGVFIKGEPVFLCTNKACKKYFGVVYNSNLNEIDDGEKDNFSKVIEQHAENNLGKTLNMNDNDYLTMINTINDYDESPEKKRLVKRFLVTIYKNIDDASDDMPLSPTVETVMNQLVKKFSTDCADLCDDKSKDGVRKKICIIAKSFN